MAVLVLNTGSSSIKFEVFDGAEDALTSTANGAATRIGEDEPTLTFTFGSTKETTTGQWPDHDTALEAITERLDNAGLMKTITTVGHRVVHGGEAFTEPTVLTDDVIDTLVSLSPLAPLHNPPALTGIGVARKLWPDVDHVAVFDTAFHATLPASAYRYAVPTSWYADHGVRRYGFHGSSYFYVARATAAFLGKPLEETKLIIAHLGNGASMAAVDGGKSIETTMGLSPLEGLVMGTRSGDLDPAVVFHLLRQTEMTPDQVESALNRESGLLGLAGSNDMREVRESAEDGDVDAALALDVMAHRVRKYIGAYYAALGGLDAVVFTAGIGERDPDTRADVIGPLAHLGLSLDEQVNADADASAGPVRISPESQEPVVLVVSTNEELEIARQALNAAM